MRYDNNTVVIAESVSSLLTSLDNVVEESERKKLQLNISKIECIVVSPSMVHWGICLKLLKLLQGTK